MVEGNLTTESTKGRGFLLRVLCLLGVHRWRWHQELFLTHAWAEAPKAEVVIAFKVCERCAASRLIHILK